MSDASPILVTGGAGYIGSHTVRLLAEAGHRVTVLDNLVHGHREAVDRPGVELVEGDVADPGLVGSVFEARDIAAVIHFAAYAYVGESVTDPAKYYTNNSAAPLVLLDAMRAHGCERFIFSSTCATYGDPRYTPMDERHPQAPINPYGFSKLVLERVLEDYGRAYGLRSARLRYFNACGAAPDGSIGEDHDPETHLIPLVLMAVTGARGPVTVFGTDYDTPDGTCVRDYIHVDDLARAHIRAFDHLAGGGDSFACNLGTGTGTSVREILDLARGVTGQEVPVEFGERRAGDPKELVADARLAGELLGWTPRHTVRDAIEHAWAWLTGPRGGRY